MALEFITHVKLKVAVILIIIWNLILGVPYFLHDENLKNVSFMLLTTGYAACALYVRSNDRLINSFYRNVTEVTSPRIKSGLFLIGIFLLIFPLIGLTLLLMK